MDAKRNRLSNRKRLTLSQIEAPSRDENSDFKNAPSHSSSSPSIHNSSKSLNRKNQNTSKQQGSPIKDFCPICQVPFPFIKIPVEIHTLHCYIDSDALPACPDGINCVSVNMFHYRDYHHNEIALWRSSADYEPLNYEYPSAPSSTKKKRSLLSPSRLASLNKKMKTPESEKVDDPYSVPSPGVVRKALFTEGPIRNDQKQEQETSIKTEQLLNQTFLSDIPNEPEPETTPKFPPLKCDVILEYNCPDPKPALSTNQSACSVACLSPTNTDTLQAVCTVNIKPQTAVNDSPVQVNLLLNESGWEAFQLNGTPTASIQSVDLSLCKCSRALTLKCAVTDPRIGGKIEKDEELKMEEKYSAVLGEFGLKRPEDAPVNVDNLKLKNAQLSIKTFFKSKPNPEEVPVSVPVPVKKNQPKAPVVLLAGTSGSTAITLGEGGSTSKVSYSEPGFKTRRTWGNSTAPVPYYKRVPGTPFVVDAFQWASIEGVRAYFLSHFHSDHYKGLRKSFNQPIYCSRITANLIRLKFGVDPKYLHILDIGVPRVLCGTEIEVFDANHCPGSLMFLFRLLDGTSILHVGDFRASGAMEEIKSLRQIDTLFLDTTYCDPSYDFPSQGEVVREVVKTALKHVQQNPKTLFFCGSYTIGKEKVFLGIAEALDCKIYSNNEKTKVLKCLDNDIINRRLVNNPKEAQVHVVYMRDLNFPHLENCLRDAGECFTSLAAFEPTGWTTSKIGSPSTFRKTTKGRITMYAVPYSEHSSFTELRRFVRFTRPKKIQVTVNLGKNKQYQRLFKEWLESSGGAQASLEAFLAK